VGSLLPSQMDQLRYKVAATTVVFRFPGTVDYGFKHWKKHHRNTFDGEAIIDFFGKTIWNPLAKPFICKTGKKVRLVFEWENKDGNALCSLLELNDGRWSIIDAWAPPDQYFRNRKKP